MLFGNQKLKTKLFLSVNMIYSIKRRKMLLTFNFL